MAVTLTKNYQKISTISLTYGEIRTYAKYTSQNSTTNKTTYYLKTTYYIHTSMSFDSGKLTLDGTTKNFGHTSFSKGTETTLQEISRTLTHNTNGTSPEKTVKTVWSATFGGNGNKSATIKMPTINRIATITNATDFTDEENPTISFSNPAGFPVKPYLNFYDKPGGTLLLNLTPSGFEENGEVLNTTYTWDLTEEQRNLIRDTLGAKSSCYCAVGLYTYSGTTRLGYSSKGVTFTNVLNEPTFQNFSFEDSYEKTLNLTGQDSEKFIKGYSTMKITISESDKATANKGATMSHYLINGTKYPYLENFIVEIPNWENSSVEVFAVDSRGISTLVPKPVTIIPYTPLTKGAITTKRQSGAGAMAQLIYNGGIWNNWFGGEKEKGVKNSLKLVKYTYQVGTSNVEDGKTTIIPIIEENKFSYDGYILGDDSENGGFLVKNSYNIVVTLEDELSKVEYQSLLPSGIPAIAIYKNNIALHGKYDTELGGSQINGDLFLNKIKMVEPNMITATISQTQSFEAGTTTTKINLNSAVSVGTKLTLSNGAITIGTGISKVLVGGEIRLSNDNTTSNGIYNIYIHNNGTSVACGRNGPITPGTVIGLSAPLRLIEVEEGDVIDLSFYKTSNYLASAYPNYGGTYLTVIAVG